MYPEVLPEVPRKVPPEVPLVKMSGRLHKPFTKSHEHGR